MSPWLNSGINQYLTREKKLDQDLVFYTSDLDGDGTGELPIPLIFAMIILKPQDVFLFPLPRLHEARQVRYADRNHITSRHTQRNLFLTRSYFDLCAVSMHEWYVLRHFWAPVAVSNTGPLPESSNEYLKDGPLGGLFWDPNRESLF